MTTAATTNQPEPKKDTGAKEETDNCACRCSLAVPIAAVAGMVFLILYQAGVFIPGKVAPGTIEIYGAMKSAGQPVPVETVECPVIYRSLGTVQSRQQVRIAPQIPARVIAVAVRPGDRVEKDDLLARLDDVDLQAKVAEATQRLASATSSAAATDETIQTALAEMELARNENIRTGKLYEDEVVSKRDLEFAQRRFQQAEAALAQSRQMAEAAKSGIAAVEQVLNQAKANLSYATVTSPLSGIVASRSIEPGDQAVPGQTMLEIFDPHNLWFQAPIREALVKQISLDMEVPFSVPALNRDFLAKIQEIVPAVDPGSRTFLIRASVAPDPELIPGMFGELLLPIGSEPAIAIPENAVFRAGQLEYVTVRAGDGTERRQPIRSIPLDPGRRRVLSGLQRGEKILMP